MADLRVSTVIDADPEQVWAVLEQVEKVIAAIRPAIQADEGDIELVSVDEPSGVVTVELKGACVTCPASTQTLKAGGAAERYAEPAIAYSPAMRKLTRKIEEVGPLLAPVLLVGEEGTGLDRIGHMLHAAGGRREPARPRQSRGGSLRASTRPRSR